MNGSTVSLIVVLALMVAFLWLYIRIRSAGEE